MPGSNARALEKGRSLGADAIIMDLEDAVSPDAKDQARDQVVAALAEGGYGSRELVIRINGLSSPWGSDDLAAAATSGAHAVLLPKVGDADMVEADLHRRRTSLWRKAMIVWRLVSGAKMPA